MNSQPNQTPDELTGTVGDADGDRHRATLDAPAGRPSSVGSGISTAVAARVTGRWTGAQFEALLEHVGDCAVFVLDEDGRVRTWNDRAEAVTGYPSGEAVGRHLSFLYPGAESNLAERDLRSAAEEGGLTARGWRVRADGTAFRAKTTVRPLREDDEIAGFVNVTRDVTDERRGPESDRCERLEDVIEAVSHDLRGPLAVAAGNARLAAETGDTSHLEGLTRALGRAEELLDYLTALASEGEQVREIDPVELREVTEAAWETTETGAATLRVEGDATFPADRCRTRQLLENLLKNAAEHGSTSDRASPDDAVENGVGGGESRPGADDGAEVTVRVGTLPDGEGFYVEDDGPGIPAEDRDRVFESGYTTSENGTGYGLAIVRTIAEAHDWSVGVTEGREGGARFEVTTAPG